MTSQSFVVACGSTFLLVACIPLFAAKAQKAPAGEVPGAVMDKYCITCRNSRLKTANTRICGKERARRGA